MNDNLNISAGLAVIFNWARELNRQFDNESMSEQDASDALAFLGIIDSVLGVIEVNDVELSEEDLKLIQEREIARQEQNWSRADEIRDYFSEKGILLEDTPDGTITVSI
jgi:cysteinyl-tRNA synthetase